MSPKTNNAIISALIFVCFILYAIIELRPGQSNRADASLAKVKQLEAENDSLKRNNIELDKKFEMLQEKADLLQQIVISANDSIIQLKQRRHEKINAIDQLYTDELFDFFANYNTENSTDR
jgi:ribonuclease HII